MTHGDSDKIKCPHCKKLNNIHYLVSDMVRGAIREFEKPCAFCKGVVYYWCRWAIVVNAGKLSEVK